MRALITRVNEVDYFRSEGGDLLFAVTESDIYDHRKKAPFPQVLPCPYCRVVTDAQHDVRRHMQLAIVVYR